MGAREPVDSDSEPSEISDKDSSVRLRQYSYAVKQTHLNPANEKKVVRAV
jgi:hypothetical protein